LFGPVAAHWAFAPEGLVGQFPESCWRGSWAVLLVIFEVVGQLVEVDCLAHMALNYIAMLPGALKCS
jgi:hypothetical protein